MNANVCVLVTVGIDQQRGLINTCWLWMLKVVSDADRRQSYRNIEIVPVYAPFGGHFCLDCAQLVHFLALESSQCKL